MSVTRISHDPLCPVCENGHEEGCGCTCYCDFIADVREDERRILGRVMNLPDHKIAAENRP